MKKNIAQILAIALCLLSYASFSDTITLSQALQNKMINISISGAENNPNDEAYKSSYTGDCISIKIENISGKNIKVFLEAGRFIQPEDTSIQRMIVTKEQMISLEKGLKRNIKVFAMCSQMKNHAPSQATVFHLSKKADGKLLELCQLISKNNFQDGSAQSAIWAMTDNNDLYDIYSDNKAETDLLKGFVRKAKGISEESEQKSNSTFELNREAPGTYVNYCTGKISGSFEFDLKTDTKLNLILYTDKGEVSRKCVQNQIFLSGNNTLRYEFTYKNFPIGNYYLKMTDEKGTVLINKLLTFK